jgi:hypothetical protein
MFVSSAVALTDKRMRALLDVQAELNQIAPVAGRLSEDSHSYPFT